MAFLIPYTLISQGIYAGLVGTIGSVTIRTCSMLAFVYQIDNPDVNFLIVELDIVRKLDLMQAVINSVNNGTKHAHAHAHACTHAATDPIGLSLMYLRETINNIHKDLENINKKINNHKAKWFNNWRNINVKPYLDSLKVNVGLLDKRFDDFKSMVILFK